MRKFAQLNLPDLEFGKVKIKKEALKYSNLGPSSS